MTQDEIANEINKFAPALYSALTRKYEGFGWIEKYLFSGNAFIVQELAALYACYKGLESRWTYNGSIDLCEKILDTECPISTLIRLKSGIKHGVLIAGYENDTFLIHDPAGNYHTNYKEKNGNYVPFKYSHFLEISIGNPIRVFASFKDDQTASLDKLFQKFQTFSFSPVDVFPFVLVKIMNDNQENKIR